MLGRYVVMMPKNKLGVSGQADLKQRKYQEWN